jgi:hypothetical protein
MQNLKFNDSRFINANKWPPNSPDLNILDYHVWDAISHNMHGDRVKYYDLLIDEIKKGINRVQYISLILLEKFYLVLFQLARDYFTSDQKYLYIYMQSLDSPLSNDILLVFYFSCFHGEIIGLRKIPSPDIIRRYFPNYDGEQKNVPNYDASNKIHRKTQF